MLTSNLLAITLGAYILKIFFPGFSIAKSHIKKPSKVISTLGCGLIGSAVAFVSTSEIGQESNVVYGQEVQVVDESNEARLERYKKEQRGQLDKLVQYAEAQELNKLTVGLGDLYKFYGNNYGDSQSTLQNTTQERIELTYDGKTQYEKIYLRLFEMLEKADTKDKYDQIEKAFLELTDTIPWRWHDVKSVPELIDVGNHLKKYYETKSQKAKDDIDISIKMINEGRILLKFLKEKSADLGFPENYCKFIEDRANYVVRNYETNDPNIKKLSNALFNNTHQILEANYHHMPMQIYKDFDLKVRLFMPLIRAFSVLYSVEEKTPQDISNALERAVKIKGIFNDSEARNHPVLVSNIDEALVPLVELSIKAVSEMPRSSNDRNKLIDKIFSLPCENYFKQSSNNANEGFFVKPFTKHYFSNEENAGNLEDFKLFLGKVFNNGQTNQTTPDFDKYTLLLLVDRNHDYFKKGVEALIEDHIKKNGTTDEELIYAFSVFSRLHRFEGWNMGLAIGLQSRVRDYAIPNLAAPIFQVFVNKLHNQSVEVTFNKQRQERYINANVWRSLNDQFREMLGYTFLFEKELLNAVYEGLDKERDPFKRQIYYETLGIILKNEFQHTKGIGLLDRLRMANTSETSCHAVREIGRLIAGAIQYEDKRIFDYGTFVSNLKKFNDREMTLSEFISEGDLQATRTQNLLYDLVRLSYGDMKLMKELMPDRRFPGPTVKAKYSLDGKVETVILTYGINDENYERYKYLRSNARRLSEEFTYSEENKRDGEVYIRTMQNAYMALAYTAAYANGNEFKDEMIRLLEGHYDWMYTNPYKWGERFGALNEAYLGRHENWGEQKDYVAKKMEKLKKKLFEDKYSILDPSKGKEERALNYIFAKTMMDSAPSGQRRTYMESLNSLGYDTHDLANIDFLIELFQKK